MTHTSSSQWEVGVGSGALRSQEGPLMKNKYQAALGGGAEAAASSELLVIRWATGGCSFSELLASPRAAGSQRSPTPTPPLLPGQVGDRSSPNSGPTVLSFSRSALKMSLGFVPIRYVRIRRRGNDCHGGKRLCAQSLETGGTAPGGGRGRRGQVGRSPGVTGRRGRGRVGKPSGSERIV